MASRAVPGATTAALLEAEEVSSQTKSRAYLRVMTHDVAVSLGVGPHAMGRVYGDEFYMREAVRVLDRAKVEVGRETTVRNDLPFAEGKVKARIKVLLSTPAFIDALAADAATFKHNHAVAIMLVSHQLQDPVLLQLLYPKKAGPCTALST